MSIIDIFSQAIEISDPDERQAYVTRACGEDAALHQQVRQMLEQYYDPKTFMANAAIDANAETAFDPTPLAEKPGDQIGPYKLLEQIGEGGMGVIYMAEQREPVVRRVALKIIKSGMDTKQVLARFEAERQALAMMNHPNIAKILDAGSTATGRSYFVMELVQGCPVTDYCNRQSLDTRERLELFTHVCNAVQHAHQKGIIHRDIKPSNILVTRVDDQPIAKVIDFGIAKATEQRLTEKTLFTNFHLFIGTPAYMSPEQAQIGAQDIDTRSDIYSLGVLLYELLTGRTPFSNEELMSGGYEEIRRRVRESEPVIPSKKLSSLSLNERTDIAKRRNTEITALNKTLRGELDWIIMKALEKDRTRRFDTANLFRQDIERYLRNEPVSAVAPSAWYTTQKFARRHRVALLMGSTVFMLLLVAVVVSGSGWLVAKQRGTLLGAEYEKVKESQEALRQSDYNHGIALANRLINEDNSSRAYKLLGTFVPESGDQSDLRGFEWRYLMGKLQLFEIVDNGPEPITGIDVSPDGNRLAVATRLNTTVWDLVKGKQIYFSDEFRGYSSIVFRGNSKEVVSVRHSPSPVQNLHFIDLRTQQTTDIVTVAELPTEKWDVGLSTFLSFDSRWAGARQGEDYGFIDFQNNGHFEPLPIESAEVIFEKGTAERRVLPILIPLNDRQAWCGSYHIEEDFMSPRYVIDRSIGEVLLNLGAGQQFFGYHPGLSRLAISDDVGNIKVFDLDKLQLIETLELGSLVRALRISPDGSELAMTTHDARLVLWHFEQRKLSHVGSLSTISNGLAYFPDGERIATGDHYGKIRIWPLNRDQFSQREVSLPVVSGTDSLQAYSTCQSENLIGIGPMADADGERISVLTLPDLQAKTEIYSSEFPLYFSADEEELVTVSARVIRHRNLSSRKIVDETPLHPALSNIFLTPSLSPNREQVALVDSEGHIAIHSLKSGRRIYQPSFSTWKGAQAVSDGRLVYSPDSGRIAVTTSGQIKVIDLETETTQSFDPPMNSIHSMAFSPDGNSLVSAGFSDLWHWDLSTGEGTDLGPLTENLFVTYSPDGGTLAICGQSSVRLWNAETKVEWARFDWPGATVVRASFDSDLRFLTVLGDQVKDGESHRSIRLYPAPSFEEIAARTVSYAE